MHSPLVYSKTLTTAFSALENTPTIDGIIQPTEWNEAKSVHLSRAFHSANKIKLFFAHDQSFLYLAADIADTRLWAEGSGGVAAIYGKILMMIRSSGTLISIILKKLISRAVIDF